MDSKYQSKHTGAEVDAAVEDVQNLRTSLDNKADKNNPVLSGKINVDRAEIYVEGDSEGCVVIHRPMSEELVPDSTMKIGYDYIHFNGQELYHEGNLRDLTMQGNVLGDVDKAMFMQNTGLDEVLGDIETALDEIIALQEKYIGGEA